MARARKEECPGAWLFVLCPCLPMAGRFSMYLAMISGGSLGITGLVHVHDVTS